MPSIDFSWDVVVPPSGSGSGAGVPGTTSSAAASDPLGNGLIRPFRRSQRNDFLTGFGVPEVLSGVGQVLGTPLGTLPWRPDFGCDLDKLRHKKNGPTTPDLARLFVENALRQWEPRAQLTSVEILASAPNVISLRATVRIGTKKQTVDVTV